VVVPISKHPTVKILFFIAMCDSNRSHIGFSLPRTPCVQVEEVMKEIIAVQMANNYCSAQVEEVMKEMEASGFAINAHVYNTLIRVAHDQGK
jgi:hypothetical protein